MARTRLRILHCFRSPVGGIFRHVRDLIEAQIADGHEVGILCDSITGGDFEERQIAAIAPNCALGVHRVTMRRSIAPSDLLDLWRTYGLVDRLRPDILHGHGAKGGAYARFAGTLMRAKGRTVGRLYTPHGGSMHYDPKTLRGRVFFRLEALLERMSDHLLFVSEYEEAAYHAKVGVPRRPARVVHNGLSEAEFVPVVPEENAADFLYLGMLRALKGPDLLIDALAEIVETTGRRPRLVVVGAGEQKDALAAQAAARVPGLVTFLDPMPARKAFRLGRIMVLPSRADSLPYVVLEALAAGKPVVAAHVGGVGEIIPPDIQNLVPPRDPAALAAAMLARLDGPPGNPDALTAHIGSRFCVERMSGDTMAAYQRALAGAARGTAGLDVAGSASVPQSKES